MVTPRTTAKAAARSDLYAALDKIESAIAWLDTAESSDGLRDLLTMQACGRRAGALLSGQSDDVADRL